MTMTMSMNDLWRAFFNGGTAEELAAMQLFFDNGLTWEDIFNAALGSVDGLWVPTADALVDGRNFKFPNTHSETDEDNPLSHLAFYNHALNPATDRGTRLYVEPNGDVHPWLGGPGGTGGFIKFFLNPISRQPSGLGKNYVDMGVGVVYDINDRIGWHDVGMALINVKSNGEDFDDAPDGGKWMDIVFMAQDGGRVGLRGIYLPNGHTWAGRAPLLPANGAERFVWWMGNAEPATDGAAMAAVMQKSTAINFILENSEVTFLKDGRGLRWPTGADWAGGDLGALTNALQGFTDRMEVSINSAVGLRVYGSGRVVIGPDGANATNATVGFLQLPSCAGIPTGVPATITAGKIPQVIDSTNGRINLYLGAEWRSYLSKRESARVVSSSEATVTIGPSSAVRTAIATLATPANMAASGRMELKVGGNLLNNSGGNNGLLFEIELDGTVVGASAAGGIVATGVQRRRWFLNCEIANVGDLAHQQWNGILSIGPSIAESIGFGTGTSGPIDFASTKDLSTTKNLVVYVTIGSHALADFVCKQSSLKYFAKVA